MKFPEILTVIIQDSIQTYPVEKIAVWVKIFSENKGDYYVPGISNKDGKILVSKNYVKEVITDAWESALMDYASTLEECKDKIEIEIISVEELQKSLKAMKIWEGISSIFKHELIHSFENSNNYLYRHKKKTFQINEDTDEITVEIEKIN